MKRFITIALLVPGILFAQEPAIFNIPSDIGQRGISIDSVWSYKVGDNTLWSTAEFDDSEWNRISLDGNLDLVKVKDIPNKLGIIWFRIRLKTDSKFLNRMHLYISQSGASEVYLDGNLIYQLGQVSLIADSMEYFDPQTNMLPIPLVQNKEHVLAIRFANKPKPFPVKPIFQPKSWLRVVVSARIYDFDHHLTQIRLSNYGNFSLVLGVAATLFILFVSFFFFFPRQKINIYFSLATFFLALQMISTLANFRNTHIDDDFFLDYLVLIFSNLYALFGLYCIYLIFKRSTGKFYILILGLAIVFMPLGFLFEPGILASILGALVLTDGIRLSMNYLKIIKGAEIIVILWSLSAIYWVILTLSDIGIIPIPNLSFYTPFAQLLVPLSVAIYFGYTVGLTNQKLRENVEEVEKLSREKEQILADQNIILEQQVKERTSELNQSLNNLKATQTQLIQSEKMASLGELTAGIAHEIQNPLNFVNNFSEVSSELITELNEELDEGEIDEAKEIASDLRENLKKINHHGQRASDIVKSMLEHSRIGDGNKELTDINKLADEYLRLAYHGLRAKDKSFNAEFEADLDESLPKINVIPQDIGRVLLNLINNAFHAVSSKAMAKDDGNYKPRVDVSTKLVGNTLEIRVSDNGSGIPDHLKEKIFQPFFTTKPTGEGTGLGLSMSYDIITKGHSGVLEIESSTEKGAIFKIELPYI